MTDVLEDLETLLPDLPSALQRRALGESLSRVALQLGELRAMAQRLSDLLDVSDMTGFGQSPEEAEKLDNLLYDANLLTSLLTQADDVTSLQEIEEQVPLLRTSLGNTLGAIKQRWRSQVQTEYRPFHSLGSLLSKIEDTSALGKRMVQLSDEATATLSTVQVDQFKAAISRLLQRRAEIDKERTSFTADNEVELFLGSLAKGSAKLESVTPAVLRWLAEHDALDLFEVRPTS